MGGKGVWDYISFMLVLFKFEPSSLSSEKYTVSYSIKEWSQWTVTSLWINKVLFLNMKMVNFGYVDYKWGLGYPEGGPEKYKTTIL